MSARKDLNYRIFIVVQISGLRAASRFHRCRARSSTTVPCPTTALCGAPTSPDTTRATPSATISFTVLSASASRSSFPTLISKECSRKLSFAFKSGDSVLRGLRRFSRHCHSSDVPLFNGFHRFPYLNGLALFFCQVAR